MRYPVVLLALVALSSCGGGAKPGITRVAVEPGPEGPQPIVAAKATGPGVLVRLDAIRVALPARLPPNPRQTCVDGPIVTITLDTGVVLTYGPCQRPASIERLRRALLAAAHQHPPQGPASHSEWVAVFRDWYDGHIDDWHSCAAVRDAIRQLPTDPPVYSTAYGDLESYARGVC